MSSNISIKNKFNPILRRAQEIINIECEALSLTANALNENLIDAFNILRTCKGKIVITGVGKSGLIGRKIVATLNSTGTPAVFMHSADGPHGDLGVIRTDDVVLALSFTGKTYELLSNINTINKLGTPIVSIVGDISSPLAKASNAIIPVVINKEACQYNLAPTSSTTVMLVLGDIIALLLSEDRKFQKSDFALYHPGGTLGKRLLQSVRDIMHPIHTLQPIFKDTRLFEVINALTREHLGICVVIHEEKDMRIAGVITDGDIRSCFTKFLDIYNLCAGDIMTPNPVTIAPEAILDKAIQLMQSKDRSISALPVVANHGSVQGIIRIHDIVQPITPYPI